MASRQTIWTFNVLPSTYCDASWLPFAPDTVPIKDIERPDRPCHRYLSPWLLREHGLDVRFHFDFADRLLWVALLAPAHLERLALLLGLVLRRDVLRQTVDGRALAGLRALLQLDETRCLVSSADHFELGLSGPLALGPVDGSLQPRLVRDGQRVLLQVVPREAAAVHGRFKLKLPKAIVQQREATMPPASALPAMRRWIVDELVPRMVAPWASLCC